MSTSHAAQQPTTPLRIANNDGKKKRKSNPIPAVNRIGTPNVKKYYKARLANSVIENNGFTDNEPLHCYLDTGMHQNGYPTISHSHTQANIQVSHAALKVERGEIPYRSKRQTASHLCHRKSCIRASHIIVESTGLNGRRNDCLAFTVDEKGVRHNACGHEPRCLLPFRK